MPKFLITFSARQIWRRYERLKEATQKRILKALNQMRADLSVWLHEQGLSEATVFSIYSEAMRENGLFSRLLLNRASNVISLNVQANVQAAQVEQAIPRIQSGDFAALLQDQAEPTSEELNQILSAIRSALPSLRKQLSGTAKVGPRQKSGGRPKELADPGEREKVREAIRNLRRPGVRLEDLFQRMGKRHGVSSRTIKRIWEEQDPSTEGK
jgi:hypothetical protein